MPEVKYDPLKIVIETSYLNIFQRANLWRKNPYHGHNPFWVFKMATRKRGDNYLSGTIGFDDVHDKYTGLADTGLQRVFVVDGKIIEFENAIGKLSSKVNWLTKGPLSTETANIFYNLISKYSPPECIFSIITSIPRGAFYEVINQLNKDAF